MSICLLYVISVGIYLTIFTVKSLDTESYCFISFFFFKQKTAYEMRISDWSSDVCSSDLFSRHPQRAISSKSWSRGSTQRHSPPAFSRFQNHDSQIGRESCRERVCQYV